MNYILKNVIIFTILIILSTVVIVLFGLKGFIFFFVALIALELLLEIIVDYFRERFQWLITKKKDFLPEIDQAGLQKFIEHGFDSELGWSRKPDTEHNENGKFGKTFWHTNKIGSRKNPGFDDIESIISCYGDSFTFSRQVNDNETWPHQLSKLSGTNVINWGTGNHGLDQTLLKLKREYAQHKTKIVIVGVVPDTISRILSRWKHFYEYGNTFGFKPCFILNDDKLILLKNLIDTEEKFYKIKEFYSELAKSDFFYKNKFLDELISFPYIISFLRNFYRNSSIIFRLFQEILSKKKLYYGKAFMVIMNVNLYWRVRLFKQRNVVKLFEKIIDEFISFSKMNNFVFVFAFLPQKDDVLFVKRNYNFYQRFKETIQSKCLVIDFMDELMKFSSLDDLYSDSNEYGGHYSKAGNEFIAEKMYKYLIKNKVL